MPSLLLIRHAQASFGEADYDVLSDLGRRQATILGERLHDLGGVTSLAHGELERQRETAAIVAGVAGASLGTVDRRWDEYDHEELLSVAHEHGALRAEIEGLEGSGPDRMRAFQRALDTALRHWMSGEPGAYRETWRGFAERSWAVADELLEDVPPSGTAAVVTSGGVIAAVCCAVLDTGPDQWLRLNRVMVNTSLTRIVRGRRGTNVVAINDHAHLEGRQGLLTYR